MGTGKQGVARTAIPPRTARVAVTAIFFANGALVANWFARVPDVKQTLGLSEGALSIGLLSITTLLITALALATLRGMRNGSLLAPEAPPPVRAASAAT